VTDADKRRVYDMQKAGDEEAAKRKQEQRNAANTARTARTATTASTSQKTPSQPNGYTFTSKQTAPPPKFSATDKTYSFTGTNGTRFTFRTADFDTPKATRFTFRTADFDDTDDVPKRTSSKTKMPKESPKVSFTRVKPNWRNNWNDDDDEGGDDFFPFMHRDQYLRDPFQDFHRVFSTMADQFIINSTLGFGGPNERHHLGLQFGGQPRPKPKPKKPDMEDDMYDWSKPMFRPRKKSQDFMFDDDDEDDGNSK